MKIEIDVFEYMCLIESAWHSGTILRHSIMQKAINVWHEKLSNDERKRCFLFWNRLMDKELSIQRRVLARYDPEMQYNVEVVLNRQKSAHEAYLFEDEYWTTETRRIAEQYIISATQLLITK